MKLKALAICLVMVTACGKKGGGGGDCADAVAHASSLMEQPKGMDPKMEQFIKDSMAAMQKAMVGSCQTDKWSSDVTKCLQDAKKADELDKCEKLLTPAQKEASDKAVEAATNAVKQPGQVGADEALAAMKSLRDRMCACADKACAEGLEKEWGKSEGASEGARHDDKVKAEWEKMDDEFSACRNKLTK